MPFEVMLQGTHRGAPVERKNPFTGEAIRVAPYEMTHKELSAVREVLREHGAESSLDVQLGDASVSFGRLDREGALVGVRGNIATWARFLFDVAQAGALAIVPTNEGPVMVTAAAGDRVKADEVHDEVVVVSSGEEIASHLAADYGAATEWISRAAK